MYFCVVKKCLSFLFYVSVKLGSSHWQENICWWCSRIGFTEMYLGLRGGREEGNRGNSTLTNFIICLSYLILGGRSKQEELDGRGKLNVLGRTENHTEFWWVEIKERYHLVDLGIDGRVILRHGWEGMNRTDMTQKRDG